jgi:hypothetical protein
MAKTLYDYFSGLQDLGMPDEDIVSHAHDTLSNIVGKQVPTEDLPLSSSDLSGVSSPELDLAKASANRLNKYGDNKSFNNIFNKNDYSSPADIYNKIKENSTSKLPEEVLSDEVQRYAAGRNTKSPIIPAKMDAKVKSYIPEELDALKSKIAELGNKTKEAVKPIIDTAAEDAKYANVKDIEDPLTAAMNKIKGLSGDTLESFKSGLGKGANALGEYLPSVGSAYSYAKSTQDANNLLNPEQDETWQEKLGHGMRMVGHAGEAASVPIAVGTGGFGTPAALVSGIGGGALDLGGSLLESYGKNQRPQQIDKKVYNGPVGPFPKNPNDIDVLEGRSLEDLKKELAPNRGPAGEFDKEDAIPKPSPAEFKSALIDAAKKHGRDPAEVLSHAFVESSLDPTAENNGAYGPFQVRKAAFSDLQKAYPKKYGNLSVEDLSKPENMKTGIEAGMDYFDLLKKQNPNLQHDEILRAFNQGARGKDKDDAFDYLDKVQGNIPKFQKLLASNPNRGPASTENPNQITDDQIEELKKQGKIPNIEENEYADNESSQNSEESDEEAQPNKELSKNEKILAFLRSGNDVSNLGDKAPLRFGPSANPVEYAKNQDDMGKLMALKSAYDKSQLPQKEPAIPVDAEQEIQKQSQPDILQKSIDGQVQQAKSNREDYLNAMKASNNNKFISGLLRGAQQASTGLAGMGSHAVAKNESDKALADLQESSNAPIDQLKNKMAFDKEDPANPQAENLRQIIKATFEKAGLKSPDLSALGYNDIVKNNSLFEKIADRELDRQYKTSLLSQQMALKQKAAQDKSADKEDYTKQNQVKDLAGFANGSSRGAQEIRTLHQQQNRINNLYGTFNLPEGFNLAEAAKDPKAMQILKDQLANKNMAQVNEAAIQISGVLNQGKPSDKTVGMLAQQNLQSTLAKYKGMLFSDLPPANQQDIILNVIRMANTANKITDNQLRQRIEDQAGSLNIDPEKHPKAYADYQSVANQYGLRSNPKELQIIKALMSGVKGKKYTREQAEQILDNGLASGDIQL